MGKQIEVDLQDAVSAYARYQELNPRAYNEEFEGVLQRMEELEQTSDDPEAMSEHRRLLLQTRVFRVLFENLIAQIQEGEFWRAHRAETAAEIDEAPRILFKTIEDILVAPEDRMAVSREDEGRVSLDSMIISPERITPTLLINLGLQDYLPPKGVHRLKRMQAYAAAVPAIKEAITNLEPIRYPGGEESADVSRLRYFRLMRMAGGDNEGMVLGTQNIRKTDGDERGEKIIFKTTLHAAERRVFHVQENYREELRKLASIEEGLRGVRGHLRRWTAENVRANENLLAEMKQKLLTIAESLDPAVIKNRHKRVIQQEISKSLTLKDSLDRYNPTVIGDRIDRSLERIGARYQDIEGISNYLGQDQARITNLVERQEAPLPDFCQLVDDLHEQFRLLQDRPLREDEKVHVVRNLLKAQGMARKIEYEPYLSLAVDFVERIDYVLEWIDDDRNLPIPAHRLAAEEFVKAYLVTKVARAYRDLQATYRRFSLNPDTVDPRVIRDEVQSIQDALASRSVAAEIDTPSFNSVWGELYHLCNGIKKELQPLIDGPQGDLVDAAPRRRDQLLDILEQMGRVGSWIKRRLTGRGLWRKPSRVAAPEIASESYEPSTEERIQQFQAIKGRVNAVSFRELAESMWACEEVDLDAENIEVDLVSCEMVGERTRWSMTTEALDTPTRKFLAEILDQHNLSAEMMQVLPGETLHIEDDVQYVGTFNEQGVLEIVATSDKSHAAYLDLVGDDLMGLDEKARLVFVRGCKEDVDCKMVASPDRSTYMEITNKPVILMY